jgi:hypothetical protein
MTTHRIQDEKAEMLFNKSQWSPGPWQDEPDRVTWTDAETGMSCRISRSYTGALCGYVAVPPGHPLVGISSAEVAERHELPSHGGITFAGRMKGWGDAWWIGFDCAHGFDFCPTARSRNCDIDTYYRTLDYVRDYVHRLAEALQRLEQGPIEVRHLSCAETAKLLRVALQRAFPGVKFRVRSEVYSGGASISVSWTEGPSEEDVDRVAQGFVGADFDGSIDMMCYRQHWLNSDGTLDFAGTSGTTGQKGTIEERYCAPRDPNATLVRLRADFVFCRRYSAEDQNLTV